MSDDRPENSEQTDGGEQVEAADGPTPEAGPQLPAPSELEKAQAEAAKLKDMLVRTAADFDNFRKRTRRELDDARRGGREDLLKELLPVFDNLERGMTSAKQANDVKAVVDGLQMILKQFEHTLAKVGIQKVQTIGASFDPMMHEAI